MLTKRKNKKQFKQKQPKAQHGAKRAEIREGIKAPGLERGEVKGKTPGSPYTVSLPLPGWLGVGPLRRSFRIPFLQLPAPDFFLRPLQGLSDSVVLSEATGVAAESGQCPFVSPAVTGMLGSPPPTGLPAPRQCLHAEGKQRPTFLCGVASGKQGPFTQLNPWHQRRDRHLKSREPS